MKKVPYYTTEDESQWCGHIWAQRDQIGGQWGFAWEVIPPYGNDPAATGWRDRQEDAERAMAQALRSREDQK